MSNTWRYDSPFSGTLLILFFSPSGRGSSMAFWVGRVVGYLVVFLFGT